MSTLPRIHAEFIKAWAEGYDIEAYNPERDCWIICPEPGWFADIEYRVRPGTMEMTEPVWASFDVRVEQDPFSDDLVDLHNYDDNYNLRLEFRDGKLINAAVLEDEFPW
jgi:hypothetical protein